MKRPKSDHERWQGVALDLEKEHAASLREMLAEARQTALVLGGLPVILLAAGIQTSLALPNSTANWILIPILFLLTFVSSVAFLIATRLARLWSIPEIPRAEILPVDQLQEAIFVATRKQNQELRSKLSLAKKRLASLRLMLVFSLMLASLLVLLFAGTKQEETAPRECCTETKPPESSSSIGSGG